MNEYAVADMNIIETFKSIGGLLGTLSVVVTIIFGALYFGKRAEKDKDNNTITTYKENDEAKTQLLATRDRQIAELKAAHEANLKRIELAESKAEVLEKQVTQAPSINKLALQIGKQHNDMMKQMGAMTQELGNIAKALPKTSVIKVDGEK